ncbi:MAG: FAD-binding oxidoreductase [Opitutaceae bacterium]|nr:FAD-binding oxidoreductase [Cytophagales bacterium]
MKEERKDLENALKAILPSERIRSRLIDRVAYSSDAGFYRLTPQSIVLPETIEDVKAIFNVSKKLNIPVTFRTGGTSLSGQAVTDGILIDLSQHWRKISPENEGQSVKVSPGAIGSWVNISLKKYGRKIGPDPSSISSAMMGGILANNASGMCCGVKNNSYHTIKSICFVLFSGSEFNTAHTEDYLRFELEEPILSNKLKELRQRILSSSELSSKINHKYLLKNTVGYSLNSFIDYEKPLDIFAHLLIGSEGTLAFIAEAVMDTLPDMPFKATALILFSTISEACNAIVPLINSNAEAVELMDRASLRAIEHLEGLPPGLITLPKDSAALLVEYQSLTKEGLELVLNNAQSNLNSFATSSPIEFTYEPYQQALLWKIRKGLFPAVGAIRKQGTTVILEDVAFPVEHLAEAVKDLQALFLKHKYENAIIFGHAKDGNLHFVITQAFESKDDIARYSLFIEEMVGLVIKKYNGSLKAEHGTGRNMAPFVETEWGADAYSIMKELKEVTDPLNLLNPGVIITSDRELHLKNLKTLPVVEEEVDKCIECGFCERLCPSRDLTLTPRKRIVVRRFISDLSQPLHLRKKVRSEYEYDGLETCAVDGLCATDCPVDINTGTLVKRLRRESHSNVANKIAVLVIQNFKIVEWFLKTLLSSGIFINKVLNKNTLANLTSFIRSVNVPFPQWLNSVSTTSITNVYSKAESLDKIILYTTCIHRMMGGNKNHMSLTDTLQSICGKSNIQLVMNENKGLCCGQAFSSKGFSDAASIAANNSIDWLWVNSEEGKYPVVTDVTSCAFTLHQSSPLLSEVNKGRLSKIKILDITEFTADYILPKITIKQKKESVTLHPVCSLEKMKLNGKLKMVAEACAEKVIIPLHAGCCGMAGDRGFFFPELIKAATKLESDEVKNNNCSGYYSTGRTCEIAMTETTGKDYVSLLYLLDEVS